MLCNGNWDITHTTLLSRQDCFSPYFRYFQNHFIEILWFKSREMSTVWYSIAWFLLSNHKLRPSRAPAVKSWTSDRSAQATGLGVSTWRKFPAAIRQNQPAHWLPSFPLILCRSTSYWLSAFSFSTPRRNTKSLASLWFLYIFLLASIIHQMVKFSHRIRLSRVFVLRWLLLRYLKWLTYVQISHACVV